MSDDLNNIAHEDIEASKEVIQEDEDSVAAVIKRRKNGQFRRGVSGNPAGRKPSSKNRHSKAKLDTMIERGGVAGIKMAMKIMQEAYAEGDKQLALRASIQFMDKHYNLVLHNEKVELQKLEAKKKTTKSGSEESEEDDNDFGQVVEFTFASGG